MENPTASQSGLGAVDWTIILVYAFATTSLGYSSNTNISSFLELFRFQSRMSTLGQGPLRTAPETKPSW